MKDALGDRIKEGYEDRTRFFLPRRTYTIIRLDGKAFHTYTRGLEKPFDMDLIEDMGNATKFLCENIQGCVMGYTQSDEISLLLTDFDKPTTNAWFDGNIQKMASISASLVTARFNQLRLRRLAEDGQNTTGLGLASGLINHEDIDKFKIALFDSRVFSIPDRVEVMNYFIWRQKDCVRNSVSMAAQATYSHKELHGKSVSDMHELLMAKGINWAKYPESCKNGTIVTKKTVTMKNIDAKPGQPEMYQRSVWTPEGAPNFRNYLPVFLPQPNFEIEELTQE